jgi:hypothetical protein
MERSLFRGYPLVRNPGPSLVTFEMVAPDAKAAKAKALAQIQGWSEPHKDKLFEVEATVDVTASMRRYGYFLGLTKATIEKPFTFVCKYLPIA